MPAPPACAIGLGMAPGSSASYAGSLAGLDGWRRFGLRLMWILLEGKAKSSQRSQQCFLCHRFDQKGIAVVFHGLEDVRSAAGPGYHDLLGAGDLLEVFLLAERCDTASFATK